MPGRIYFDTVAFRQVGKALEKTSLAPDLKEKILISPLTVFEILSQLTTAQAKEVLKQIHAILNWTNSEHTGLLQWPDDALSSVWYRKAPPDDGFTERMQKAFNTCLAAESVEELQEEAGKLKDVMDRMKEKTARDFGRLLQAARKEGLEGENFSKVWFQGIANRVNADPKSRNMVEIVSDLNAYHEFERNKLRVALDNKDYNPQKHKNDLLDAEQLIYLSDPSLHFLTCDKGFSNLVGDSPQAKRIITCSPVELLEPAKVEALMCEIQGGTNPPLLSDFAKKWKLKVEGERIRGYYGFIVECDGQLWCWTHSHTPEYGHRFFAISSSASDTEWDEVKAVYFMVGPEGPKMNAK